jgi:hypothetical protein
MSPVSKFVVLVDSQGSQFSLDFIRESEAWAEFWKQVAQQADDGQEMSGFDPGRVLASRTGLTPEGPDGVRRWYIHLMKES